MKTVLASLVFAGLLVLVGTAGALDHGDISFTQAIVQSTLTLVVTGICTYLLNRHDD